MEPIRPVHAPWVELTADNNNQWEPDRQDRYTGSSGSGYAGPSSAMQEVARKADSLCAIFLFILPLSFFSKVAQLTNKYCYEDWVVDRGEVRQG